MTTARNAAWTESFFQKAYPNTAGNTINAGDMIYYDSSTKDVKALDSDAHAQYFVGVAGQTSPITVYGSTANTSIVALQNQRVKLLAANGVTFTPEEPVYYTTNAQTVTNVPGNYIVGFVANIPGDSQQSLVGTGSNYILIDLAHAYPTRAYTLDK